jgi:hypothetical protein
VIEAHSHLASYSISATSARSGLSRALDNSKHPEFNLDSKTVELFGSRVHFTAKEYQMLELAHPPPACEGLSLALTSGANDRRRQIIIR